MNDQKTICFRRLILQSLPEFFLYQLVINLILSVAVQVVGALAKALLLTKVPAITTANLKSALLSWQGAVVTGLGILVVFLYLGLEYFALVYFCDDILKGRQGKRLSHIFSTAKKGLLAVPKFLTPFGFLILVYTLILMPLIGFGFIMDLTKSFRVPDFVMDVVLQTASYSTGYYALRLVLFFIGVLFFFSVHGVLIGGLKPFASMKQSLCLVRKNWKSFFIRLFLMLVIYALISAVSYFLFVFLPHISLITVGETLPKGLFIDPIAGGTLDDTMKEVLAYRFVSTFALFEGNVLYLLMQLLALSYLFLRAGRFYLTYTAGTREQKAYAPRMKRHRYLPMIIIMLLAVAGFLLVSAGVALTYSISIDNGVNPAIVAHRTGGRLASENSVEGIYRSIEEGVYGGETDIQRTKDGFYIINHDDTFGRLTGVDKKPAEMTLAEVKELRIKDTTGSGELLEVPTIEDLMDACGGKLKLFIEFKGPTADERMVEETVALIKEKYSVEDVVLISLDYDVINYTETHYPEFETGLLMFAAYGNIADLNCDIIMMEEDMITAQRLWQIHNAGKRAAVWTVNHDENMDRYLAMNIDYVITDEIIKAKKTAERLNRRTDMEMIRDTLIGKWGGWF